MYWALAYYYAKNSPANFAKPLAHTAYLANNACLLTTLRGVAVLPWLVLAATRIGALFGVRLSLLSVLPEQSSMMH